MSELKRQFGTYPDGQLQTEWFELNGKTHGLWRKWHPNGQLAFESPYNNGLEDGTTRSWDQSGKLIDSYTMVQGTGIKTDRDGWQNSSSKVSYRRGQFHGPFEVFWPDGKLASRIFHFNGRQVSKKKFLELTALESQGGGTPVYIEETAAIEKLAKKLLRPKKLKREDEARAKSEDAGCEERLARSDAQEARTWLAAAAPEQQRRIGNCQSTEESRAMIDALYAEAPDSMRVTVMEIHKEDDLETTDQFVLTLPDRSTPERTNARARLLARSSLWAQDEGFDPVTDIGQKYQFVWFD